MNTGIYIHIPFCRTKCEYCSFYSVPTAAMPVDVRNHCIDGYIKALLNEIHSRIEYHGIDVDTVYIGGGTPSLIPPPSLSTLICVLKETFAVHQNAEITIECNPEDIDTERIHQYIDSGVNRLTLGVQSVSTRMHSRIGRRGPVVTPEIMQVFMDLKNVDHCIDLITGIPLQQRHELEEDIRFIERYRPEHISAYMLSIEKGTPLSTRMNSTPEDEPIQRDNYFYFIEQCIAMGYCHYEISNFALPGHESKHNLKYWKFMPYIGFGASAHTFYNGVRSYNNHTLEEYIASDIPCVIIDERSKNQMMAEYLMTALRLFDGFSDQEFYEVFREAIPEKVAERFDTLSSQKLVTISGMISQKQYSLTMDGLFLLDTIVYHLTEPLL